MKQKDIALIIVIIFVSAVASYFISGAIVTSPNNPKEQIEIVEKITSDFTKPDPKYFNSQSVDPTRLIQIGDNANPTPFQ